MRRTIYWLAFFALTLPLAAKDLGGRVGIGVTPISGIPHEQTGLSIQYFPSSEFGLEGVARLEFDGGSDVGLGGHGLIRLKGEPALNLYLRPGLDMHLRDDGERITSLAVPLTIQIQYFLPPFPDLGLELGIGLFELNFVDQDGSDTYLKLGVSPWWPWPPYWGFHYYF
jgi:hypothetical protein